MGVRIHQRNSCGRNCADRIAGPCGLARPGQPGRYRPAGAASQIRQAAIADAQQGTSGQGDVHALARVMDADGHGIPAQALMGNWRCRQMKLGRMTSYMVYDAWFACNIRPVKDGIILQKMNGSQRFIGFLYPENGAWVYVGASSARGEPYHNYSGRSPAIGAQVTPDDQIGLLTGIGNNHLRLEMPAIQESLLDVVEFAR